MRSLGLQGIRRSKGIRTTIPAKDGTRAADLLNRDFTAPAPNLKWVMDFTYCRTWVGFVYVAFILDVFAQKIVAWHASTVRDAELVLTPLKMAIWQRGRLEISLDEAFRLRRRYAHLNDQHLTEVARSLVSNRATAPRSWPQCPNSRSNDDPGRSSTSGSQALWDCP